MGFAAVALPIIGAATSLAGGLIGGMGQEEAANYQAQVARNNAMVAQEDAAMATRAGEAQAANQGLKTAQTVGKTRAAFGAAGVDTQSGSAVDVAAGQEGTGITDEQTILSNAAKTAWGYETQATSDTAQAGLDVQQGRYGLLSSLLSGTSSAAGNWARLGNMGTGAYTGTM